MASSNEITQIKQIKSEMDSLDTTIQKVNNSYLSIVKNIESGTKRIKDAGLSYENLGKAQKQTQKTSEELDKIGKQLRASEEKLKELEDERVQTIIKNRIEAQKLTKQIKDQINTEERQANDRRKAADELSKQRNRSLAQLAKQEAKERELIAALELEVKTEEDAIKQNAALRKVRRQVDTTTDEGIKKIEELNSRIDRNTNLLKGNADSYVKQKMNIGSYKEDIIAAAKETEVFGVSINKATDFLSSGAGILTAVTAAVVGLGKAYASSARGAEDMARASDRLNSIAKSLGNTLADASGEGSFFDNILGAVQLRLLGVASTIDSNVQVAILSTIRQLEILEADQERQKKAQLDRAEQLRQIRDDERNSFEERKRANDELGEVITERENETIKFQQEKLKNYQTLLKFDEGNIEIQQAIKQIEFEIADAREEAQGFRSEQLANDLSLSRDFAANELELQRSIIEGQIANNEESYDLRKRLIDITLELELEAAGKNEQLRQIAIQKAKNENDDLTRFIQEKEKEKGQAVIDRLELQEKAIAESSEVQKDEVDELFETFQAELDEDVQATLQAQKEKLDGVKERVEKEKELERELQDAKKEFLEDSISTIFDINSSANARRLEELEAQKEAELANESLTAEERARIEEEFTEKKEQLNQRQKVAEKLQSAIEVGINAAKSIFQIKATAAVLLSNPLTAALAPIALAQIPFVLGSAGLALAGIAAYAKGTDNAKSEFIAGEKGRELMTLKSGETMIVDSPTYFKGSQFKGAKIKSNAETERIIKSQDRERTSSLSFNDARIINGLNRVEKAIMKKPTMIVDKNSNQIGYLYGRNKNRYLNKLING